MKVIYFIGSMEQIKLKSKMKLVHTWKYNTNNEHLNVIIFYDENVYFHEKNEKQKKSMLLTYILFYFQIM